MFKRILVANRGEIACRIVRTARRMGISTVAVYSEADRNAPHVEMANEAVAIGPSPAAESYLQIERIVAAARETGAEAVHPGYGFLAENAAFNRALEAVGIVFVGPPAAAIEAMGDKLQSKRIAEKAGVAIVPGHPQAIADPDEAANVASDLGYPVMIKASAGGGGKGMRIAVNEAEVREGFARARSEARSAFGDDRLLIEKFIEEPRHIEIQVLADARGNVIHLGERECSIQRRHQKIVEEAPSPFLDAETRAAMGAQAVALAAAVGYRSAGTVEFLVDRDRNFYFLEMNTRLQVEHPVTELVTGIDLVEEMIRIAAGEKLRLRQSDVLLNGWAVEARIYAEDPARGFLPSVGRLTRYCPPAKADLSHVKNLILRCGPDEVGTASKEGQESTGNAVVRASRLRPPHPEVRAKQASKGRTEHLSMRERGRPPSSKMRPEEEPERDVTIRIDSGVVEGSEISLFYDPMIAKLCTHAPDRAAVIGAMADALDAFTIDGVRHNIPFLAALMAHPRWREGRLSTAFIEQEFLGGFRGATLDRRERNILAAIAVVAELAERRRLTRPAAKKAAPRASVVQDWVLMLGRDQLAVSVNAAAETPPLTTTLGIDGGEPVTVRSAWRPGERVWRGTIGGEAVIAQLERRGHLLQVSRRGISFPARLMTKRAAALAALMPENSAADSSKLLLCPMPGLVVTIAVSEGQKVEAGETLAVVEAMKMENVLRAERSATVARILVGPGDSLAVDAVIMEFA